MTVLMQGHLLKVVRVWVHIYSVVRVCSWDASYDTLDALRLDCIMVVGVRDARLGKSEVREYMQVPDVDDCFCVEMVQTFTLRQINQRQ